MDKAEGAFLTIGELARELGVAQHILRYWETRFSQLKPLQRSGNRRYYRPADVAVARRINQLLNGQGFTVRGAQRMLDGQRESEAPPEPFVPMIHATPPEPPDRVAGRTSTSTSAAPSSAPTPAPSVSVVEGRPASPTPVQPRFGLDDLPPAPSHHDQMESSDIALLIARLTVIRDNLSEAVGLA